MAHSDPHPIFVKPVKDTIKAALVRAGISDLDIQFNAVERNGATGARIISSPAIPPSLSLADQRSSGGQRKSWHGPDGRQYVRVYRYGMILTYQVELWSESLSQTTGFMFDFLRFLPRHCFDGQVFPVDPDPPSTDIGNRVELTATMLVLPDDTTSTAKQYKASVQVRADGALWEDEPTRLNVETRLQVSPNFA